MSGSPQTFAELVSLFIDILSLVIPLIFGVTLLFIIWKIVETWIISGAEPSKIEEGKKYVTVGILVLVVMSAVWGILELLQSSLF